MIQGSIFDKNETVTETTYRLFGNTCLYIHLCKLKKHTYMYESLQFPVEMNSRGSKTLASHIQLHMHEFSSNYKEVKIARLHQQMCFYITFDDFYRVGFGVNINL